VINYGIHNEQSDLRVHVCPQARSIYVYPTASGIAAIDPNIHQKVKGYQDGIDYPTAEGFLVPPMGIAQCILLQVRPSVWDTLSFSTADTTTVKGVKAVRLVVGMLKAGLFPLPGLPEENIDRLIQINGTDITVEIMQRIVRIQVKCDYPGGEKRFGGTGRLFLQIAEINPLGRH